jgi:HAE1 family hydrophobic/amphiphilic exporter-1
MNLPAFSVGKRITTLMIFFGVIMVGLMCLSQTPIDLFPKMDIPSISVTTTYEGAAPVDVESKVAEVLERYLSTVPELKHIVSSSREGMCVITLTFEWGTDLDTRANDIRDAVGMAKRELPDEVDEPRVYKFNINSFPIVVYGVSARESYPDLEDILQDEVADPLARVPGVAAASVRTPLVRQVNVDVDRERLAAHGLTPLDVARTIFRENTNTPGGSVKMGLTDYLVRVPGEFDNVADMRQIVLASRNGSIVRLSDVGTVEQGFEEVQQYITVNGNPGAIFFVQKQSEANTVPVARAVKARLEELKKRLPADIQIVNIMDQSEDIERTIRDLFRTLIEAALLATLVVVVFLRRWRASFVVGLTIPFSLILALIPIYVFGYTLNMISLFAMTIAVGRVVDDAIVILEVITRHRESGERPREGAIYGASEVAMAVIASTLTTVCVFFPVMFIQGITKILFGQFVVVVTATMLASLFSALTLTPMLSATLMKRERFGEAVAGRFFRFTEAAFNQLAEAYGRVLIWALGHRKTVVGLAVAFFAGSMLLVPLLGTEFFPEEDRAMVSGTVHFPVGTRVEETARAMQEVARMIQAEIPAAEQIALYTRCGTTPGGGMSFGEEGSQVGSFTVKLVPKTQRSRPVSEIATALRRRIDANRGLLGIEKFRIETGDPLSGIMLGGEQPLTVNVLGDDMEVTDRVAAQVKEIALATPGTVDIAVTREKGAPELWVNVDRDKASALGLNVADVGDMVRASFYGRVASKYRIRGKEYDILVRLREGDRSLTADVAATPVRLPSGQLIRAENVAKTSLERGPVEIQRKDRSRVVNVTGSVYRRSLGEVVADVESKIKTLDMPRGVEIVMAGQTEQQRESFGWLIVALIIGMALVFMVMASQFESLLDPFVVMFSVPFAFTGSIWALFLGGFHVGVVVFIGLLFLVGIVVSNAIVLVDYTNVLRARGLPLAEAVPLAGKTRLRPVLMTALATIFGLAPMAFGKGQASEVWNPIGLTVMGGMLVSTLVTLVFVPTLYSIFETHVKRGNNHERG